MNIQVESLGGEYMDEATVVEVMVQAGARVTSGDVLVVLETAKAQTEIIAPVAGVVETVDVAIDEEVSVGQTLMVLTPS